jgi:hypothetical protein
MFVLFKHGFLSRHWLNRTEQTHFISSLSKNAIDGGLKGGVTHSGRGGLIVLFVCLILPKAHCIGCHSWLRCKPLFRERETLMLW